MKGGRKGFTLTELMIVVAVIGILSVIAVPSFQNSRRHSYSAEAKTNLGHLRTIEEAYRIEYGRYNPHLDAARWPFTRIPAPVTDSATAAQQNHRNQQNPPELNSPSQPIHLIHLLPPNFNPFRDKCS